MEKITRISPPKAYWVTIEDFEKVGGTYLLFGLVNQDTPHESFSKFFGRYDTELKKWLDSHGDVIEHTITHFLYVE